MVLVDAVGVVVVLSKALFATGATMAGGGAPAADGEARCNDQRFGSHFSSPAICYGTQCNLFVPTSVGQSTVFNVLPELRVASQYDAQVLGNIVLFEL